MEWFLKVVKENYANFDGRARRKEYWMYTLCVVAMNVSLNILTVVLSVINEALGGLGLLLSLGLSLALLMPSFAVMARRLHDTGKPTWYILLGFIPFVNFYVVYLLVLEGDHGPNAFGPDPKEAENGFPAAPENNPFTVPNA